MYKEKKKGFTNDVPFFRWIDAKPSDRKELILPCLQCLRLGLITTQYFVEKVKVSREKIIKKNVAANTKTYIGTSSTTKKNMSHKMPENPSESIQNHFAI